MRKPILAAIVAALAFATPAMAQQKIKIGFITTMSGQAALKLENSQLRERAPAGTRSDPIGTIADWENEPAERCPECKSMWRPGTRHCSCGVATVEAALPLNVKGKFQVELFIVSGGTGVL